jgi:hypothetical protein
MFDRKKHRTNTVFYQKEVNPTTSINKSTFRFIANRINPLLYWSGAVHDKRKMLLPI